MNLNIARERLSYVAKPDSITYSQGDFLVTHVAVRRLHILNKFDVMPVGGKNYTEEQIYREFVQNKENKHQFIAVYGQSGTGKSHLIRWFEARYEQDKPENEVVLFIKRSDNTLKGTIRQLLEKPEVQGIANRGVYDRLVKASVFVEENKLKDMIYHNFIIEIHNDDDSHSIRLTNVKRKRLEAFLNNEVVHDYMVGDDGPIERIYSKIAENTSVDRDTVAQFCPDDFFVSTDLYDDIIQAGADPKAEKLARELMADGSGADFSGTIAGYLNQFVNDVIQRCAGIEPGDFRQIFQDIRRELYRLGKNLTLFIEDVTSFTGVDDALLDALLVEHAGMNTEDNICRISSIVGTTSNYLQNNFRDNHKDRITKYVYIPNDAFDENGVYELVGRYLNAMSLEEKTISEWISHHAEAVDYPVHETKEGLLWEHISIGNGKKLCLYPFTKHAIKYLYDYALTKGHKTPRYIIRDIIEPVVRDILDEPSEFPDKKYTVINIDANLNIMVHNQIKDDQKADRLFRFLSIWGDGKPDQYTDENILYISSIRKEIFEEFGFPIISLSESASPKKTRVNNQKDDQGKELNHPEHETGEKAGNEKTGDIPIEKQEKLSKANEVLSKWQNGQSIDVSSTTGVSGTLRAAQQDISSFFFSIIDWQSEGIPYDDVQKMKPKKNSLVYFERQTKGTGLYKMPANWQTMNIILAFVRWREYGNQSWNYPGADLDVYSVTSWAFALKQEIISSVREKKEENGVSYIEAAITAEIYRMILFGEFREKQLNNLTVKTLFENTPLKHSKTYHSKEWDSLVSLIKQKGKDSANSSTVSQYFNIVQGEGGSNKVLDYAAFAKTLRKVKTRKLSFNIDTALSNEEFKLRKDVYSHLKDIYDRVDKVASAELDASRSVLQQIYDSFEDDDVEEDDVLDLLDTVKNFYNEINDTQINIAVANTDAIKRTSKQIAKAIKDIGDVLDEKDTLTILMTFSGDPLYYLMPFVELLNKLDTDIRKVGLEVEKRKSDLGDVSEYKQDESNYSAERDVIDQNIAILNALG